MANWIGVFKKFLARIFSSNKFAEQKQIQNRNQQNKNNKPMEFGIGGTQGDVEVGSESVTELSKNRTMFITQLTDEPTYTPELIYDVQNMNMAFETFKPSKELSFTTEDGSATSELIEFQALGDFGPKGITQKSNYLKDQKQKEDQLRAISKELKSNKALQGIISNPETKEAFLSVIKALVNDLEQAG
jgi:hypothetical protein